MSHTVCFRNYVNQITQDIETLFCHCERPLGERSNLGPDCFVVLDPTGVGTPRNDRGKQLFDLCKLDIRT